MKIAVIGTGYVGLVTGTCLAETGNKVVCVDINKSKIDMLQNGKLPIYEPGLDSLFQRNIDQNRLTFTTDLSSAISEAKIIFLALPTPPGDDGSADLSYVLGAAREIAKLIVNYTLIVTKSTVPVGTADKVRQVFLDELLSPEKNGGNRELSDFVDIVSNPEFLREGVAVEDFMKPDRVVVGTTSDRAQKIMSELYTPYVRQGNPIIFMDERSSELTKYAANSFLATKISFMNEIGNLCELVGADVDAVRRGIGSDERIGKRFLFPGIGYGGSCFPKDVQALGLAASEVGYDLQILNAVMNVNIEQRTVLVKKLKLYYGDNLKHKKLAIWGLAFKPETDDVREAPSLYIIQDLLAEGVKISVHDPEAMSNVQLVMGDRISYHLDQYDALNECDALLVLTEWSVFRNPDFDEVIKRMKSKVIFDGRNLYDIHRMVDLGFYYNSIGRKTVSA